MKDILVSKTVSQRLSPLELARKVKTAINGLEKIAKATGSNLDPVEKRGGFREEIGHYLPLAQYQPPISVEGHAEVDENGYLISLGAVLEFDHTGIPDDVRLESATAPLRDRRTKRNMSELDKAEVKKITG